MAPIEKPSRWKVSTPSASAKASDVRHEVEDPRRRAVAASQPRPRWPRRAGRERPAIGATSPSARAGPRGRWSSGRPWRTASAGPSTSSAQATCRSPRPRHMRDVRGVAHRPSGSQRRRLPPPRTAGGRRCTIGAMTDDDDDGPATRIERDSMGEMEVPADALYGASTQRAVLNFPISGQRFPRRFIRGAGPHQAGGGRDQRRPRPPRCRRRGRDRRRGRARSPTAPTTTSSRSTSTRPARAPRPTRT